MVILNLKKVYLSYFVKLVVLKKFVDVEICPILFDSGSHHANKKEIVKDENATQGPAEYMSVIVNGEAARIPNLDFIEKHLLPYRST